MIGFEVRLNGHRLCTAGGQDGVLTAIVSSVARRSELKLEVGALLNDSHLTWETPPGLVVGDEITIRVVETDHPDPAVSTTRDDAELVEEAERTYYERLKSKYEAR
jgi:hypothetical protein